MKKYYITTGVVLLVFGGWIIVQPSTLDFLFPTCNETWMSVGPDPEWKECSCAGLVVNVTPGVQDYVKDVCIGIPAYK